MITFVKLQTGLSLSCNLRERGKSGQHRATHRLIAGPDLGREESATENNCPEYSG